MNKSKNVISMVLKIIAFMLTALLCIIIVLLLTQKPKDLKITNIDASTIKDGVYVGSADNGLVKAAVSVEISNGKIVNVSILDHDNLLGKPAEKIVDSIVEQQSLDVDAIASATYSSDTIRKAVENALRQGE